MAHLASSMITQEVIQAFQSFRQVRVAAPVHDIDVLAGMGVEQAQLEIVHGWLDCFGGNRHSDQREQQKQ